MRHGPEVAHLDKATTHGPERPGSVEREPVEAGHFLCATGGFFHEPGKVSDTERETREWYVNKGVERFAFLGQRDGG